jgi:mannose-6-phosphate isomerase-like protein (cupin superfamily)
VAKDDWRVFDLAELLRERERRGSRYLEFLRVPALSCGVFHLPVGARDLQGPHDEDEVYFVISGRGRLRVGSEDRSVQRGSILYVRATSEHHFFEIEEEMTLLVFFGSGGPDETPPASARH